MCSSSMHAASTSAPGIGHALPGDIRRRAVHGLEDRAVDADVRARREPESADESGDLIGENVAEQIRRDDDVESLGMQHEVHRHRVDDALLELDAARVVARDHAAGVEKQSLRELQDVRLVDERHLLAVVLHRVLERVAHDALRPGARDDARSTPPRRADRRRS